MSEVEKLKEEIARLTAANAACSAAARASRSRSASSLAASQTQIAALTEKLKAKEQSWSKLCEENGSLLQENRRLREALEEAIDQLWHLAKDPKNNALIKWLRARLEEPKP